MEPAGSGATWTSAARPQAENGDVRVNALEPARRRATIYVGYTLRPSSARERKKWVDSTREKLGQPSDLALLQKTFDRMK